MIRQILKVRLELLSHIVYELSRIFLPFLAFWDNYITGTIQKRNKWLCTKLHKKNQFKPQ